METENPGNSIGSRIREIRQVLEITTAEMARITGVTEAEYIAHEEGKVDCSFSFIYHCAERFGVDISQLVLGESPKLSFYTLTRNGGGMPIKRREEFEYRHLAPLLKHRQAEPFVVKADYQDESLPISLSTHTGQEFDYVLSGSLRVQLDDKIELLNPGDSVFYDSGHPHGMVAATTDGCEFLAIVIRGEGEAPVRVEPVSSGETATPSEKLICHRFIEETIDADGHLQDIKFHYPENYNFAYDVLDVLAAEKPNRRAMVWLDHHHNRRDFSFGDIARGSARAANLLASLGIVKGDRVMLVLKRHYQFWFLINALHRIGAVAIPATHQLQAKDFEYRFKAAGVKAIVAVADPEVTATIDEAGASSPTLTLKIAVGDDVPGWHNLERELPRYSDIFPRPADLRASDPALMYFSSGTTGYPKLAVHSHTYSLGHIVTARWWQCVEPGGLHLTISDTGWGKALWGKLYGQWFSECAVFVYDFDRFHAADILGLFAEYQITSFCAPPTMYRFFIKEDLNKYDLSSIKHASIAGEALNPEVFYQFQRATGLKLMEGFGQTETTLVIGNLAGTNPKPGSMGKASPQYHVELLDHDGMPVKPGEVGEIVIRAERDNSQCGLFLGYYADEERTAEVWQDGRFHTGDTAWQDEDGYFWYVGRVDDLIKSSGYRIGPFEVESVIMELPYVLECAVIGVPDEIRGQLVKAVIVLTAAKEPSEELIHEIQEYVKHHTAPYKYPRVIEFVSSLPKTISGKIRRTELRKTGK